MVTICEENQGRAADGRAGHGDAPALREGGAGASSLPVVLNPLGTQGRAGSLPEGICWPRGVPPHHAALGLAGMLVLVIIESLGVVGGEPARARIDDHQLSVALAGCR